jgi:hypothetical protein
MRALRRLRALSGAERRLLVEAALLLAVIRAALWLLPFEGVRRVTRRLGRPPRRRPSVDGADEARLVWAVGAAGRGLPRITCLVRALAAQALLARHGRASELRLGVARRPDGAFAAHAWLEREGRVLLGGAVTERYAPLPPVETPS